MYSRVLHIQKGDCADASKLKLTFLSFCSISNQFFYFKLNTRERIGHGVVNQTVAENVNHTHLVINQFVWLPKGYSDPISIIPFGKTAISGHQKLKKQNIFSNFVLRFPKTNTFFSNINIVCSCRLHPRNLQEQVKKTFRFQYCSCLSLFE